MNESPSRDEGHAEPPFTPVEGGSSSSEEEKLFLPKNFFVVVDLRRVNVGYQHFMVQNLMQDCLRIFGSGNFQVWENPISICVRVLCDDYKFLRFLPVAKETARIWGAPEAPMAVYPSDYPRAQ